MADKPKRSLSFLAAGIIFAVTMAFQWKSGAYQSDIGAHPDEPAHVVTGLMMRDYFLHGLGRSPMAFIENYYDHYPKVALGHYPPAFYVVEGAWTLVFPPSRASLLILSAAFSALLAWLTWRMLVPQLHPFSAAVAGLLCCALPLVQRYTSIIMSDLMLGSLCLLAALAFAEYLKTGKAKYSLLFGFLAAGAILTKAGGIFLALVPGVALILAGRFGWWNRLSLWAAVPPVLVFCLPWMLLTYDITHEGMAGESSLEFARKAIPFYLKNLPATFGLALLIPSLVGIISIIAGIRMNRTEIDPFWAVILAMPVSLLVFYCLVPAGLESRYLLPAVPAVIALALLGLERIQHAVPARFDRLRPVLPGLLVLLFLAETFYLPVKHRSGFREAANAILERRGASGETVLISSDASGEGAFIAELALREPHPRLTVLRSSKELATSDWMGRNYEPRFRDAAALRKHLAESAIRWIVTDNSMSEARRLSHHDLLESAMREDSGPIEVAFELPASRITRSRSFTGTLTGYRRALE